MVVGQNAAVQKGLEKSLHKPRSSLRPRLTDYQFSTRKPHTPADRLPGSSGNKSGTFFVSSVARPPHEPPPKSFSVFSYLQKRSIRKSLGAQDFHIFLIYDQGRQQQSYYDEKIDHGGG